MAQYCDSAKLELDWLNWLLSSSVPALESYRRASLLWTKVIGIITDGARQFSDPVHPIRAHCLALSPPIYFNSYDGVPQPHGTVFNDGRPSATTLPICDAPLLSPQATQDYLVVHHYLREQPTDASWHSMLNDVNLMCHGIAAKFNPKTEEDRAELSSEAFVQVIHKLSSKRLVYTPGRAPVFNLLTTTIYRIMYSIMNRRKSQRERFQQVVAAACAGAMPYHSLQIQPH